MVRQPISKGLGKVSCDTEVLILCTELPRVTLLSEPQFMKASLPITLGSASVADDPIRTV